MGSHTDILAGFGSALAIQMLGASHQRQRAALRLCQDSLQALELPSYGGSKLCTVTQWQAHEDFGGRTTDVVGQGPALCL